LSVPDHGTSSKDYNLNRWDNEWHAWNDILLNGIGNEQFFYNSGTPSSKSIEDTVKNLYRLSDPPYYNIQRVFEKMGYASTYISGGDYGRSCVLKKEADKPNPFHAFKVAGISKRGFHFDEYPFPQVHRFVDLSDY